MGMMCTDLCEHCIYIECGDFVCDITNEPNIVAWKPFPCTCIEKRRCKDDSSHNM